MRFRNGFAIFERTSCDHTVNLASFHSRHSLTWRWVLSFARPRKGWGNWFLCARYPSNSGWILRVPYVGTLTLHTQEPMWYRDLYLQSRDAEFDREMRNS